MEQSTKGSGGAVRVGGRVAHLVAPRTVELTRSAAPEPGPDEALIRVRAVGLCGTDVHAFRGRSDALPVVLGHDLAGTVAGVGAAVTGLAVGDRVTVDPTLACGACGYCLARRPELCASGSYLGMTSPGALAEFLCLPARNVVALPAGLGDADATLLEPVVVALHLLDRIRSVVADRAPAVVIGGGPLGLVVAQVLRLHGHDCVVLEPVALRRDAAAALGLTARPPGPLPAAERPRLLVETSASPAGFALAGSLATPGSVIGVIGRAAAEISAADVLLRELAVVGVRGGHGYYPQAARLVAQGEVSCAPLVTHQLDLDDVQAAFELVTQDASPVLRAMIRCAG